MIGSIVENCEIVWIRCHDCKSVISRCPINFAVTIELRMSAEPSDDASFTAMTSATKGWASTRSKDCWRVFSSLNIGMTRDRHCVEVLPAGVMAYTLDVSVMRLDS